MLVAIGFINLFFFAISQPETRLLLREQADVGAGRKTRKPKFLGRYLVVLLEGIWEIFQGYGREVLGGKFEGLLMAI